MKAVASVAEILDKAYRQSSVNKKQHPPFRIRQPDRVTVKEGERRLPIHLELIEGTPSQ